MRGWRCRRNKPSLTLQRTPQTPTRSAKSMLRIFLTIFALTLHITPWAKDNNAAQGTIESMHYDSEKNQLHIGGLIEQENNAGRETTFEILAHGKTGVILNKIRTGKKFDLDVEFTSPLPGGLTEIQLTATSANGEKFRLPLADGSPPLVHVPKIYIRHWILLGFTVLAILLACTTNYQKFTNHLAKWTQHRVRIVTGGIILLYALLVSVGATGSSLRIALESPVGQAVSEATGSKARIFKLQASRGDEWGILMPNVLAQIHHTPPFPIINTNIGIEGQNMGVVGMTGVPIAQWAAIARPATWGYFFLPLRQAQSWQWQLPFWGCLLALWWLLNTLKPHSVGRNLALSGLFCVAPYAAAWSNWPLYFTLFPAVALTCFLKLCDSRKLTHAIFWGASIGYAFAAWVLTLYPPWIISIGTLCAFLCVGWILDRRSSMEISGSKLVGIATSLVVATAILGSWWLDTRDAIELMRNTVYPGQRTTLTGGTNGILWAFRGYTNPEAITFGGNTPWTNQPEISSYIWLPFAIGWLCIYGLMRERKNRWLLFSCTAFIAFYFNFAFIGIPEWLAHISQWGRVPTNRTDVSLGLAFIVLLCLTNQDWFNHPISKTNSRVRKGLMIITTAGSLYLVYIVLSTMPAFVFPKNSAIYTVSLIIFTTFCVWQLTQGRTAEPIALFFLFFLTASLGFNPITKAPKSIELTPEIKAMASDTAGQLQRTLFVNGEGMGPHFLAAVGLPMVNGVLSYPQSSLWEKLHLPNKDWPIVNRYQHLAFTTGIPSNNSSYSVSSPWMEWVVVTINPENFEFHLTGAQRVAAFEDQARHLRKSAMLKEIGKHKGLIWFSVESSSSK